MSLVNFSLPYPAASPFLPATHPYHYPRPQAPFTVEDVATPTNPPTYTRVKGDGGSKTRVHAVIDYDDDGDYYDDDAPDGGYPQQQPPVTPIQGPIFLKNGKVPVVPLYSYPQVSNGTFVQIPVSGAVYNFRRVRVFFHRNTNRDTLERPNYNTICAEEIILYSVDLGTRSHPVYRSGNLLKERTLSCNVTETDVVLSWNLRR